MIINSNDIFSQIGLAIDPNPSYLNFTSKPKYVICLEIELSEQERHILEVKNYDDPHLTAVKFCNQHKLNKLAINIVENKIREAMNLEEQKFAKQRHGTNGTNGTNQYTHNQRSISKHTTTKKKKQYINKEENKQYNNKQYIKQSKPTKNSSPQKSKPKTNRSPDMTNNDPKKDEQSKSKSKPKPKLVKNSSTDNIYLRGLVKSRLLEERRNKKKVEMEKQQEEELTFQPKINHVSAKIVEFLKVNDIPKPKKQSPPKNIYDEMKQCTFKPKINKTSERIVSNKNELKEERENHKKIFENEDDNKSKKTVDVQQYSFKPQINPKSSDKVTLSFFKRLQLAQEKRNHAISRQISFEEDECSFKPKINRGPYRERNKENDNIWDYLYQANRKDNEEEQKQTAESGNNKDNSTSQQYYENLIEERINSVFSTLDNNNDGLISPNQIAIENLSTECLYFLKPIFLEMDQINATLNCYQFKKAVKALMADSDPGSKGVFIAGKWKKQQEVKETFKPSINKRSKQLTSNRSVENLYREGVRERQKKEYQMEKERALRQEQELMECSFKPVLNHSSKVYIQKISKRKVEINPNKNISQLAHSYLEDDGNQ